MHPYIATGPEATPAILTLDPRVSLSYLARRCWDANPTELTQQTFGCAYHTAWPAWEHDILVRLVEQYAGPHREQVIGLAAATLMRKDLPTTAVAHPFAELLKPKAQQTPIMTPPTKGPRSPQGKKPSALQTLLAGRGT
jgi:hypothetical protein